MRSKADSQLRSCSGRGWCRGGWICALVIGLTWGITLADPGPHHDVERLTALLNERPDDLGLLIERAHYCRLDKQYAAALKDLDRAEALAADRPDIHFHRGLVFVDESRHEPAEREFTAAINGGLTTGRAYAARARVRVCLEKTEEALADYEKAIALEADLELFVERGAIQVRSGRLEEAEKGYLEAVAKLGDSYVIRSAQIDLAERRGCFARALEIVDEQLSRSRVKTDWLLKRAEIHERMANPKAAKADLEAALTESNAAIARKPVGIHLVTRARVLLAMGRREASRQDVLLALSKSPAFIPAKELLAQLDSSDTLGAPTTPANAKDVSRAYCGGASPEDIPAGAGEALKHSAGE